VCADWFKRYQRRGPPRLGDPREKAIGGFSKIFFLAVTAAQEEQSDANHDGKSAEDTTHNSGGVGCVGWLLNSGILVR